MKQLKIREDNAKSALIELHTPIDGGGSSGTKIPQVRDTHSLGDDFYFNPGAEELVRTWHDNATHIYTLNAYPNGVTFSSHLGSGSSQVTTQSEGEENALHGFQPSQFHLRFRDTRDYLLPTGRYFLYKEHYEEALEKRLSQLHEQGKLESSVIYFGITTDPFFSFPKKFNVTMNCLALLERYRPGLLVIQTRSPLVIAGLPTLRALGTKAVVALHVETRLDSVVNRYTPGQPSITERMIAADGLRQQGIKVNFVVSPILPYGEITRDAWEFAELLDAHSDYITFGALSAGRVEDELKLKHLPVAQKLVVDKQLRMLRPHSYRNLYYALKILAPQKLLLPKQVTTGTPLQLNLFAA